MVRMKPASLQEGKRKDVDNHHPSPPGSAPPAPVEETDPAWDAATTIAALTRRVADLERQNEECRQREQELRQRHNTLQRMAGEFQTLLDTVPDRITCLDRDLRFTWVNRAAAEAAGREIGDMLGQPCYLVFFRRDSPCPNCPVLASFQTGRLVHEIMTGPDGRTWDLLAAPIRDDGHQVTGVIEVGRDISHQTQLEDQFRQAQKMEAIGQLAGGVAHDFNNILSAIIGFAELIRMDLEAASPLQTHCQQILEAAQRARTLTQSLLIFSRRKVFDMHRENLTAILTGFHPFLRRLVREDITLIVEPGKEDLWILGDRTQIEQVIMNLATNARDAMPNGGTLRLTTERVRLDPAHCRSLGLPEAPAQALLTCSDTGTGIPDAIRDKIFEPFFTTKEPGKGTGLGLSTVFGIVQQHHGHLACHSEVGKGTVFRVYLPLAENPTAGPAPTPAAKPAMPAGRETILLAEDFPNMRAVTRAVLSKFGYQVIEAVDGVEALEKFHLQPEAIDLVLLDGIMPRKNGVEVFREIRRTHPRTRILFMTGYIDELQSLDQLNEQGVTILLKPVSPSLLLSKIRELLDEEK